MSIIPKTKTWTLDPRLDDSDPSAKTLILDIMKALNNEKATILQKLPASKFTRDNGYILGIKIKESIDSSELDEYEDKPIEVTYEECPVISIDRSDLEEELSENILFSASEPEPTLHEVKGTAYLANLKVAENYNSLKLVNVDKLEKKLKPQEWLKDIVWEDHFGSLKEALCPVCSRRVIKSESFSLGHILAEKKGGMMIPENLMPICSKCNSHMATNHLFWFAFKVFGKIMWPVY